MYSDAKLQIIGCCSCPSPSGHASKRTHNIGRSRECQPFVATRCQNGGCALAANQPRPRPGHILHSARPSQEHKGAALGNARTASVALVKTQHEGAALGNARTASVALVKTQHEGAALGNARTVSVALVKTQHKGAELDNARTASVDGSVCIWP
jgi:hypothetical protein